MFDKNTKGNNLSADLLGVDNDNVGGQRQGATMAAAPYNLDTLVMLPYRIQINFDLTQKRARTSNHSLVTTPAVSVGDNDNSPSPPSPSVILPSVLPSAGGSSQGHRRGCCRWRCVPDGGRGSHTGARGEGRHDALFSAVASNLCSSGVLFCLSPVSLYCH